MVAFKFKNRRDGNEKPIVDGLRRRGVKVIRMDEPFDLLVGYDQRLHGLEVKNPATGGKLTKQQVDFHLAWGEFGVHAVETLDEALEAIGWTPTRGK